MSEESAALRKEPKVNSERRRTNAGFDADQARRHVGQTLCRRLLNFAQISVVYSGHLRIVPGDRDRIQLVSVMMPLSAASPRQ